MRSHAPFDASSRARRAFTLIELLVVIAIMAILIGVLLPALGAARKSARTLKCLANIRSVQQAQLLYCDDYKGSFIDVHLPHGGGGGDIELSFVTTLADYYSTPAVLRSPGDTSPFWPVDQGGQGLTLGGFPRSTSYGMNNYLSRTFNPGLSPREPFDTLAKVPDHAATIQFLMMVEEDEAGGFAVSDHVHVEGWGQGSQPPGRASSEVETHAWGGSAGSWNALASYSFLDGHAVTLRFKQVYTNFTVNKLNPARAH